jgi:GT2 family glycosyltransferase/glycosyltransferase involved in cell wall biosynthesis
LNWNGRDLLAQGLPTVLEAVRVDGRPHEVMVVDNGSTDGSVDFLKRDYPSVRILPLEKNLGFAEGNNAGVRAAAHDIVVLLNNDMVVEPGFLRPLLEGFSSRTFAVASQIYHQDPAARREETGKTSAEFRRGMIDYSHRPVASSPPPRELYPAFWAGGGSSAFHRRRFLRLGGFQEIYSPAYVEDTDISYRAWKRGWHILFAPRSVVYHKHRASSKRRFSNAELNALIQRNQLLFIWKNIGDWRLLLSHCLWLPWNCYRLARDQGLRVWLGILQSILRLPASQVSKLSQPCRENRSDREIFQLFSVPGLFFRDQPAVSAEAEPPRPRILWVTAYLPHLGKHAGAGRMFHLLKRLAPHYRITLLSFLEEESEREFLPQVEPLCEEVIVLRRTPPFRWQLFAYEPFDEFRTPQMEEEVRNCLEHYDYKLIQLEYSQMACYAQRIAGIPTLLTKHEVDFAACARRARLAGGWKRLRWFYNYLQVLDREIKLLKRVDGAICMTVPDRQELLKFQSSVPIHVINTGVDLDYFQPTGTPPRDARLIFVGAFQHAPNVDAMLFFCRQIFPRIRAQVPGCELLIVGSNPPPVVVDLAETPGVEVTGFTPDIRPSMASSAVYVVPLRLGVGIRGKILEAWGMGMAVVATSVACAGLNYTSGKDLLLADEPGLFADHVVTLLRDPSLRERLGAAGRELVLGQYGWESAAGRLHSLYQQYIQKAPHDPSAASADGYS